VETKKIGCEEKDMFSNNHNNNGNNADNNNAGSNSNNGNNHNTNVNNTVNNSDDNDKDDLLMQDDDDDDAEEEAVALDQSFRCLICHHYYEKAVTIKVCGHSYCSLCIRNHWMIGTQSGVHRQAEKSCPTCRTSVMKNGNNNTNNNVLDIDNAIIMNRGLQEGVKAYKNILVKRRKKKKGKGGEGTLDLSSTTITNRSNESPIQQRMPSRNYSTMTVTKLQQIYRELQLPPKGDQQALVNRLRTFQCMWNAELDSIDPKTPSQLVAELKEKERLEREEKSKEILSGSASHTRYLKTVKEGNIHNDAENKDLGAGITKIVSGNMKFDQKMNMNFTTMIAQVRARQQQEKRKQKNTTRVLGAGDGNEGGGDGGDSYGDNNDNGNNNYGKNESIVHNNNNNSNETRIMLPPAPTGPPRRPPLEQEHQHQHQHQQEHRSR